MATAETYAAIAVPRSATRLILYQRTGLSRIGEAAMQSLEHVTGWRGRHWAVGAESAARGRRVRSGYAKEIATEFASIAPHLPQPCASILDIGCGLAGIDAALYRHLDGVHLHLLDRDVTERKIAYGFRSDAAFYNSTDATMNLLAANGVPRAQVELLDAASVRDLPRVDLVLSLLSWGFHYPIAAYLDAVVACLAPGGRVIVDVRKGTGDTEDLLNRFAVVTPIIDDPKRLRVVAHN